MYLFIVVALVLPCLATIVNGFQCPNFVPTSNQATLSQIGGTWYNVQLLNINIKVDPDVRRCQECQASVNSHGTVQANSTHVKIVDGKPTVVNFVITTIPIDHNLARIAVISSFDPDNAQIRVYLDFVADKYFVVAFCQTVDGKEGYTIYVYAREKKLSPESLVKIKKLLRDSNLSDDLKPVYQGPDCYE